MNCLTFTKSEKLNFRPLDYFEAYIFICKIVLCFYRYCFTNIVLYMYLMNIFNNTIQNNTKYIFSINTCVHKYHENVVHYNSTFNTTF